MKDSEKEHHIHDWTLTLTLTLSVSNKYFTQNWINCGPTYFNSSHLVSNLIPNQYPTLNYTLLYFNVEQRRHWAQFHYSHNVCHCWMDSMGFAIAVFHCTSALPLANMYEPSTHFPMSLSEKQIWVTYFI